MQKKATLIFILLVSCVFVLFFSYDSNVSASKNHKISSYAWSENIGWVSLNCYNDGIANKCLQSDYGVDYDTNTDKMSGFGWSEYGGWLCFGESCGQAGLNVAPDKTAPVIRITDNGLLTGWANWTTLGEAGWLKLQGPKLASAAGTKYSCRNCAQLKGQSSERCGFCFSDSEQKYNGNGSICEQCQQCQNSVCQSCSTCYQYGVGLDYSLNYLFGWGADFDTTEVGFGWLNFVVPLDANVNAPYVETVAGDIYAGAGLGSLFQGIAPIGKYNATYMLQSNGDIIHFASDCEDAGGCESAEGWVSDNVGKLELPKQENNYRGSLGILDIKGLLAGQYGKVEKISTSSQIGNALAGKVYYAKDDLTIDSAKTFLNSLNSVKASGTIVVRGDLHLDAASFYQTNTVKSLKNLASVGWIVLKKSDGSGGNIYIDPAVENLVGNFFAEGKIYTGTTGDSKTENSLRIDGLLVASGFSLQRQFTDWETREPAERIVYDGRVISNTPPGFADLTKALPLWK
ncbi:MAG: hypothetical protein AAB575_00270 [Patescibacteria group bacterium]